MSDFESLKMQKWKQPCRRITYSKTRKQQAKTLNYRVTGFPNLMSWQVTCFYTDGMLQVGNFWREEASTTEANRQETWSRTICRRDSRRRKRNAESSRLEEGDTKYNRTTLKKKHREQPLHLSLRDKPNSVDKKEINTLYTTESTMYYVQKEIFGAGLEYFEVEEILPVLLHGFSYRRQI